MIFKFTAPGTPQQISVVERRIPILMGRARAMLIQAGIDSKGKGDFWCEVTTKLDNIMVRQDRTKPPYTLFYKKDAKFMKYLRTFGEMAVVAIHEGKKMRSKLDNRGKTCIFLGYADDHAGDVYRFLNIHSKRIIMSRDARWLNIIWKHYRMKSIYARKQAECFLDEEERSFEEDSEQEQEEETEGDGHNTPTQRKLGLDISMIGARKETLGKTRSKTQEMSSPKAQSMERADLTMEDYIQETCLISAVTTGPTEPRTFQEAWHCDNEKERNNWRTAIRKEMRSMVDREFWRKTERKEIPNDRRLIGNKWVFKNQKRWDLQGKISGIGV